MQRNALNFLMVEISTIIASGSISPTKTKAPTNQGLSL